MALDLFRSKGYDHTSLNDLTEALNINKPSLFAAFGNKECLFKEALNTYVTGPAAYFNEVLNEKTTKDLVRKLLTSSVEVLYYKDEPHGCLVVMSSASEELQKIGIQQKIASNLRTHQQKLEKRFELAKDEGELPPETNCEKLAIYLSTIHKGLSLQAINGATKEELLLLVEQVLDLWPSNK